MVVAIGAGIAGLRLPRDQVRGGEPADLLVRRDARALARRRLVPHADARRARRAAEGDDGELLRRHGHRRDRRLAPPLHRHEPRRVPRQPARRGSASTSRASSRCGAAVSSRTAASSAASSAAGCYLQQHKIRLLPWADVAVPSLASGLLITRIGCYLFGCDFGKRLARERARVRCRSSARSRTGRAARSTAAATARPRGRSTSTRPSTARRPTPSCMKLDHSWPVHPTQIYESLVGLALLVLLLWQRKHQKFRGQIFFLFAFAYGYLRFLIEMLRDDSERGEFGTFPLAPVRARCARRSWRSRSCSASRSGSRTSAPA